MKTPAVPTRNFGLLIAFICITLVLYYIYQCLLCCNPVVILSSLTSRGSPFVDHHLDIFYKYQNGSWNIITVDSYNPEIGGTAIVNLPFPEKAKGEYIKVGPDRDSIEAEVIYYKHGRQIFKNSKLGEQAIYDLPAYGCVNLQGYASYSELLFFIDN